MKGKVNKLLNRSNITNTSSAKLVGLILFVIVLITVALSTRPGGHASEHIFLDPTERPPLPSQKDLILRRGLIGLRDEAMTSHDLDRAAYINSLLASEALLRTRYVYKTWMKLRNPETGLFPQSESKFQWNYRNTAADFFCFQLHAGIYMETADINLLFDTLKNEAKLGKWYNFPSPKSVTSGKTLLYTSAHPVFGKRGPVFGVSEYVKDGLLSLYEATGDPRVYKRMKDLTDLLIKRADHSTPYGPIPSKLSEVNGEMLQVLARIARKENDKKYEDMLARITDAVLLNMLAQNNGLHSSSFNYEKNAAEDKKVPLRDHGNEILPGLAEAYAFAVDYRQDEKWNTRAEQWTAPITLLFEKCMTHGFRPDGLLANAFHAETLEITDPGLNDNWGYVSIGVLLFASRAQEAGLLEQKQATNLIHSVRCMAEAVAATDRASWEGSHHDGYADSVESALLVAHADPDAKKILTPWIDDQIGFMLESQRRTGFVSRNYLDGNFIRTAIMYADMRTGGWKLSPWDKNTAVGFASQKNKATLTLRGEPGAMYTLTHRSSNSGFANKFIKKTPRLNAWPDWFLPKRIASVTPDTNYPNIILSRFIAPHGWKFKMPASGIMNVKLSIQK